MPFSQLNKRPSVDAGMPLSFTIGHHWPGTSEAECSATPMRCLCVYCLWPVLVLTGCSTGPEHVPACKFERSYIKNQTVMMEQYFYAGETNGCIYISHMRLPRTYYSKMKYQLLYTETNGLPSDFLEHVRQSKPDGPKTYWSGRTRAEPNGEANRSQPIRSETNRTPEAAGSRR